MKTGTFVFLASLGGSALGAPTPQPARLRSSGDRAARDGLPSLGDLGGIGGSGGESGQSSGGFGDLSGLLEGLGGLGQSGESSGGFGDLSGLLEGFGGLGQSGDSSGGLGGLDGLLGGLGGLGQTGESDESSGSSGGLGGLSDLSGGLGGLGGLSGSSGSSESSGGLGGLLSSFGGGSSTENGVTENKACQPLTFIFARGTTEMGNMGSVVGPPVATALKSILSDKVTVQGVDYPASSAGNAALGAEGGPEMLKLAEQALSQCPGTKVALGGYSQGAMVVHNAAKSLDQISAAVVFGDPLKTMPIGSLPDGKVKGFCAEGDPVCANGANFMAHISYGGNAEEAAQFIVQATGVQ